MSLGGYASVARWKDVGNEMMWRKLQCVVSKAPGKNYGLIKNQWDRWNLTKYEDQYKSDALPERYRAPCFDPKKAHCPPPGAEDLGAGTPLFVDGPVHLPSGHRVRTAPELAC